MNTRHVHAAQGLGLAAFVSSLEYLARSGAVGRITLVPPSEMGTTLVNLLVSGEITGDIWQTFSVVLGAFSLAVLVGIPAGWALWQSAELKEILDPFIITYYAIPVFVFYPLLLVVFGFNRLPILLIAFAMGVVAVVINTANGFEAVDQVYLDVGRAVRLSRYQRFRHIALPAALPYVFTGLKLGFIYSLIGVIASEFILAGSGLGYLVSNYYTTFNTAKMYAVMLFVVIVSVAINQTLLRIEGRLYQHRVNA
ncbi:nitrate ABC transporter permease [Halobacteriales archaeon SW_10_66_29]|nr:MAG: nitrate ABC transporter permease [Halobacteriales archaeon SW_10_66_29]